MIKKGYEDIEERVELALFRPQRPLSAWELSSLRFPISLSILDLAFDVGVEENSENLAWIP